jgi:hypothetical protein
MKLMSRTKREDIQIKFKPMDTGAQHTGKGLNIEVLLFLMLF